MSDNRPISEAPSGKGLRIAVVRAEWNDHITSRLSDSAVRRLKELGVADKDIETFVVPGAVELTFAAARLTDLDLFDAVIAIGCVIKGDTPHFDFVCRSVTDGITNLNWDSNIPVIFGVLTVDNEEQAIQRTAGGTHGDKGAEAADAALKMAHFNLNLLER